MHPSEKRFPSFRQRGPHSLGEAFPPLGKMDSHPSVKGFPSIGKGVPILWKGHHFPRKKGCHPSERGFASLGKWGPMLSWKKDSHPSEKMFPSLGEGGVYPTPCKLREDGGGGNVCFIIPWIVYMPPPQEPPLKKPPKSARHAMSECQKSVSLQSRRPRRSRSHHPNPGDTLYPPKPSTIPKSLQKISRPKFDALTVPEALVKTIRMLAMLSISPGPR